MKKLILIIMFLAAEVVAYDYSGIDIVNIVGKYPSNHYDAIHTNYWMVSNGLDEQDLVIEDDFCADAWLGGGFTYSKVEGQKCLYDYRPCDSNVPFDIKLFFCGTVGNIENHLWIDYYVDDQNETFGDKTIILQSNRLFYGFAIDVRKAIEKGCPYGGGEIQLIPIAAGSYNITNPYGSAVLHIGTRSLGDLNTDGICDLKDFAYLVADWQKPQGKYKGDITGIDGVPDGFVDFYDLRKMAHEWLR